MDGAVVPSPAGTGTGRPAGAAGLAAWAVRSPVSLALAVAVAYAAGALAAFRLFQAYPPGPVLFMPAGVTLTALVLSPVRRWPWVLAGAGLAELVVDLSHGQHLAYVWGFVLSNTVEPLVGAGLLRRRVPRVDLSRRRSVLWFVVAGVLLGPLVGALVGATAAAWGQGVRWIDAFGPYWTGDGLGVLTVGGTLLMWRASRSGLGDWATASRRSPWEQTAAVTLATAATVFGFWPGSVPLAYLPVPVLFGIALRYGVRTVPMAGLGVAVTANVMTAAGRGPWAELATRPQLGAASLQLFLAVAVVGAWLLGVEIRERERAHAVSRQEISLRQRVQAVQTVTARLATAATSEAIGVAVAELGIALVADRGMVAIGSADSQEIRCWATPGYPAELAGRHRRMPWDAPVPIADVVRTGRPVAATTAAEIEDRYPGALDTSPATGTRSTLMVPVLIDQKPVGALAFGYDAEGPIDPDVHSFAGTLATLTAHALERARLYESERSAAHQLQRALLLTPALDLPGAAAAVAYRPADSRHEVGGDWYDLFGLPGGKVAIVVGDAVGHDLHAAAAMGRLQTVLRVAAADGGGPAGVLAQADLACEWIPGGRYATVGYAEYDPGTGLLRYACAGHPPPLLCAGGQARFLPDGRSQPLGAATGGRPERETPIPPGSILLWYSDGLVERRGESLQTGLARLADLAATVPGDNPATWCTTILAGLTGQRDVADDVVVICVRLGTAPVLLRAAAPG